MLVEKKRDFKGNEYFEEYRGEFVVYDKKALSFSVDGLDVSL